MCKDAKGKKFIGNGGCPTDYKVNKSFRPRGQGIAAKYRSDLPKCVVNCVYKFCETHLRPTELRTTRKGEWEMRSYTLVAKDSQGNVIAKGVDACFVLYTEKCIDREDRYSSSTASVCRREMDRFLRDRE